MLPFAALPCKCVLYILMPTTSELHDIAKKAERIFARYGLACCLTGGVACELYGTTRSPNVRSTIYLDVHYSSTDILGW